MEHQIVFYFQLLLKLHTEIVILKKFISAKSCIFECNISEITATIFNLIYRLKKNLKINKINYKIKTFNFFQFKILIQY